MLPMSRSAEAGRPYHHGQLREALLDAAFELLQRQTASQISLREIARQAGVSHAAPYHYFPDRTQLLSALAEKCNTLFYAAQAHAARTQTDPTERLIALGEAYVQFAAQHPNAFTLIFDPEFCPPGEGSATAKIIKANHALLTQTIQDARAIGSLQPRDAAHLSAALWGTVHGLAHLVLLGHLPAEVVPHALRAMLSEKARQPL